MVGGEGAHIVQAGLGDQGHVLFGVVAPVKHEGVFFQIKSQGQHPLFEALDDSTEDWAVIRQLELWGFVKRVDRVDGMDEVDGNGTHPAGERRSLRNLLSF